MSAGSLYFVREEDLFRSRPRMVLSDDSPGVREITFDYHRNKVIGEVTIECFSDRWAAPPGSVVVLEDQGPASKDGGRWLVSKIAKPDLFSVPATVTLRKPMESRPEPDTEVSTPRTPVSVGGGRSGGGVVSKARGQIAGSPKEIIDSVVAPLARSNGINVTAASVAAANGRHGPTVSGTRSDHQGPPEQAWAADMSNGSSPTPQMDATARAIARRFDIPWSGVGAVSRTAGGYRFQMIYRSSVGGNHFKHVHFGIKRV